MGINGRATWQGSGIIGQWENQRKPLTRAYLHCFAGLSQRGKEDEFVVVVVFSKVQASEVPTYFLKVGLRDIP